MTRTELSHWHWHPVTGELGRVIRVMAGYSRRVSGPSAGVPVPGARAGENSDRDYHYRSTQLSGKSLSH